jgi:hypothetical protein
MVDVCGMFVGIRSLGKIETEIWVIVVRVVWVYNVDGNVVVISC